MESWVLWFSLVCFLSYITVWIFEVKGRCVLVVRSFRVELTERLTVHCCPYWGSSLCAWTMQSLLRPSFGQLAHLWTVFFFLPPRQPPPFPSHFPPLYTDLLKQRMCMDVFIINKPCWFYLQHVKADIFKVQHRSGSNAGVTNHCNDSCFLLVPMNQQLLLLLNTPVVFRTTTAVTSPDVT